MVNPKAKRSAQHWVIDLVSWKEMMKVIRSVKR